jgi:hypothetical protein
MILAVAVHGVGMQPVLARNGVDLLAAHEVTVQVRNARVTAALTLPATTFPRRFIRCH